jgi:hypothetical protein
MIVSKFRGKQKLGLPPYDFEYENKIMNLNHREERSRAIEGTHDGEELSKR